MKINWQISAWRISQENQVYTTNTLVTRGNVMEDDSGKDTIIIIQPTITQNEDGTEKFLNVPPEVKAIVKGKELRSGDIVQYTTKATPMTGDGSQHSEQTIFLLAIDPEEEGIKLAKTLRKSLQRVTTQGENVERTIYGTVIPQAAQENT